jgi:hypothetical protein
MRFVDGLSNAVDAAHEIVALAEGRNTSLPQRVVSRIEIAT